MTLNRRTFLTTLIVAPFIKIKNPKPTNIFLPTELQRRFLESDVPLSLYGIPYHSTVMNTTGQWLGISRA